MKTIYIKDQALEDAWKDYLEDMNFQDDDEALTFLLRGFSYMSMFIGSSEETASAYNRFADWVDGKQNEVIN